MDNVKYTFWLSYFLIFLLVSFVVIGIHWYLYSIVVIFSCFFFIIRDIVTVGVSPYLINSAVGASIYLSLSILLVKGKVEWDRSMRTPISEYSRNLGMPQDYSVFIDCCKWFKATGLVFWIGANNINFYFRMSQFL